MIVHIDMDKLLVDQPPTKVVEDRKILLTLWEDDAQVKLTGSKESFGYFGNLLKEVSEWKP